MSPQPPVDSARKRYQARQLPPRFSFEDSPFISLNQAICPWPPPRRCSRLQRKHRARWDQEVKEAPRTHKKPNQTPFPQRWGEALELGREMKGWLLPSVLLGWAQTHAHWPLLLGSLWAAAPSAAETWSSPKALHRGSWRLAGRQAAARHAGLCLLSVTAQIFPF